MKIVCIGGGPSGLYFALLYKKARPDADITVVERNAAGVTFGWGVVFSDETLSYLEENDPPTHAAITKSFAHWTAIDIHYKGACLRSDGHGFSGIARKELLQILQDRCRELGVHPPVRHRGRSVREAHRRRGPRHRVRRREVEDSRAARRRVQAERRASPRPLHLARDQEEVRRVHVLFRRERARHVPGACLSLRRRHEHVHRRV